MSTAPVAKGRTNSGLPTATSLVDVRQDVAEALVDYGYSLVAARNAADAATGASFSEIYRSALEKVPELRTNGGQLSGFTVQPTPNSAAASVKTIAASRATVPKICRGFNGACSTELHALNRSGLGKRCWANKNYAEKYSAGARRHSTRGRKAAVRETIRAKRGTKCGCGRPEKHRGRCRFRRAQAIEKTGPPQNQSLQAPSAVTSPPPVVLATLHVNEEQLNRFLTGLPLADKERMAQAWLSGEQS